MNYRKRQSSTDFDLEPSQQAATQESTSRSQLLESVTLARAALLARRGKLKQAETLLLALVNRSPSKTSTLDLLAKVFAQQKKIKGAQGIWLRALQIEPSNTHFLRALIHCAKSAKA